MAFHAIWLQQMENIRAGWGDEEKKVEFRMALVWNPVHRNSSTKSQPMVAPRQKAVKELGNKIVPAKLGTKSCAA